MAPLAVQAFVYEADDYFGRVHDITLCKSWLASSKWKYQLINISL